MRRASYILVALLLGLTSGVSQGDSTSLLVIKLTTLWRQKSRDTLLGLSTDQQQLRPDPETLALYYLPASPDDTSGKPLSGLRTLYGLEVGEGDRAEIMASTSKTEVISKSVDVLGFLWSRQDAVPGLLPVVRGYDRKEGSPALGQHTILTPHDSQHRQAPSDYAAEGPLGYAYPRFVPTETLVVTSGGGVSVKSNINAGGAIWEWWWNGKQFVNDYDNGRQLSMAVYTDDGKALDEAGDQYGGPNIAIYERHPAPCLYVKTSTARVSSRAIPLEWLPAQHGGGEKNPVIYANALIGKDLTLDWSGPDKVERNWPVALYESVYQGPPFGVATVEAPTGYLNAEFTTYYKYDPSTDSLSPIMLTHDKKNVSGGAPSGLIVASGTGPGAPAMGVYINDPNAGIVLYDNSGPGGGKYGSSFSKWGVIYRSAVSDHWVFRTWIATDTVENLRRYLKQLYLWKVTSRDLATTAAH